MLRRRTMKKKVAAEFPNYFYIENLSGEDCTVTLSKTGSPTAISLDYSTDNQSSWTTFTTNGAGSFTIPANSKAYVKGDNSTFSTGDSAFYKFSFSQRCNIGGNIMSLVRGQEAASSYMFYGLFYGNTNLVDASLLILPATTLADYCYCNMFNGCTSLTEAPALPATTLDYACYSNMFRGCTSLTEAPALPATTLAYNCYSSMFANCSSLVNAPDLPATTLDYACYSNMFYGCTSLVSAPALPATTLASSCYYGMFRGCTSLTEAPALPATTLQSYCYQQMFYGCTSLVNAPDLPATTLKTYCYYYMFNSCTKLTRSVSDPVIRLRASSVPAYAYAYMFSGCTSLVRCWACARTITTGSLNYMFYNCSNFNYVDMWADEQFNTTNSNNWLYGVASVGTVCVYDNGTWADNLTRSASTVPPGWRITD